MIDDHRELNIEELGCVTGGGIVDTVLAEAEESTAVFLRRSAEFSQRFNVFINTPANPPAPSANPE